MCNQIASYSGMIQYFHLCDDQRNYRIQHQLIDIIVISYGIYSFGGAYLLK